MTLETTIERVDGPPAVTVAGARRRARRLELPALIDDVRPLYDGGTRHLLLDLTDLTFMSSSGLVALHSILRGHARRGAARPGVRLERAAPDGAVPRRAASRTSSGSRGCSPTSPGCSNGPGSMRCSRAIPTGSPRSPRSDTCRRRDRRDRVDPPTVRARPGELTVRFEDAGSRSAADLDQPRLTTGYPGRTAGTSAVSSPKARRFGTVTVGAALEAVAIAIERAGPGGRHRCRAAIRRPATPGAGSRPSWR